MGIEVEKLVFAAEAELKQFEREMNKIPSIVEDVSRKAEQKSAKYAKANEAIQRRFADAGIREQKRLTSEVLRELDKRNKAASAKPKGSGFMASFAGNTASNVVSSLANEAKDLAVEGVKLNASFDKLARFTSTLDKNFQTPEGLKTLKRDMQELSTIIPQDADKIAQASFSVKSAFQQATEPELIQYLKEFGLAATASNTDIASHTENVIALAKQYNIAAKDLRQFNAMIASSYGQALASDEKVAAGFNKIVNSAKATKQPLGDIIAAMSTLQSSSSDAEGNTTLLVNVLSKITDGKYQEGFQKIGVSVFDAKGNFRALNEIINDMAKSMNGLNDEQINKKFDFLKDQQAREGFLTLARQVKDYNDQLKNGADTEAFANKTKVMLDATENQWKIFWAKIETGQREFGGRVSRAFSQTFGQTTTQGSLLGFFNTLAAEFQNGIIYLIQSVTTDITELGIIVGGGLAKALGFDSSLVDAASEKMRQDLSGFFDSAYLAIEQKRSSNEDSIKQSQKKYWENILVSPMADESLKAKAKANLEALNNSIQTSFATMAQSNFDNWKKVGDEAVKGLQSADPAIKAQAKQTISNLNQELVKAAGDSKYSPEMVKNIQSLWKSLPAVSVAEINQAKPQINNALSNLIQPNVAIAQQNGFLLGSNFVTTVNQSINQGKPQVQATQNSLITAQNTSFVTSSGFKIGTSLWQGVVSGINSGRGEVQAASASLGVIAESGMRTQIDSHSPSRVFAEIGKDTVDGYVKGLNDNSKKIKSTLTKTITKQVKDLKKELKDALDDLNASIGGYGQTSDTRSQLITTNNAKSDFEALVNLRNELGFNVNKPIVVGDMTRELAELEKIKTGLSGLKTQVDDFLKEEDSVTKFRNSLKFLDSNSATEGFRKLAEESGKTVEQFKKLSQAAITAEFIADLIKTNDEFLKMADPYTTELLQKRADALDQINFAIQQAPENQRDSVAAQYGIKMPTPDLGGEPPELKIKKAKMEFETLAGFLNQTFTDLRERGWRGMLDGMVLDLGDALQQMFVKWITSRFLKALGQPLGSSDSDSGGGGGGFWSKLLGIGIKAVTGGFSAGGSFGVYNGPDVGNFAQGGWVNPVPGGVFANIAEGGYPEAVLSTNPLYRERSARIAQKFQAVSNAPSYKFPQNYAANIAQNKGNNSENQMNHFENHFHFHADRETGKFSKASAQQEIKRYIDSQKNEARRR